MIAAAVLAMFFGVSIASAATPKAACYNAKIATQGLMYQVNLEFNPGPVWDEAYFANVAAQNAFFEAFAVENGDAEASLLVVRDYLDEALVELFYLSQMNLPGNIEQSVESAMWYTNYARNIVNKKIQYQSGNMTGSSFNR
jgi:hypothetical protein